MKKFASLRPLVIYNQSSLIPPKGEKPGFGNAIFLVSPSKDEGCFHLLNHNIRYRPSLYKHYYIDTIYKEKLGYHRIVQNNTGVYKKEFAQIKSGEFGEGLSHLIMVTNANKQSILSQKRNIIVNLGQWLDLYFQNQIMASNEKICRNFFQFLGTKLHDSSFEGYRKMIVMDIDEWLVDGTKKLALDRKNLTNPLSILLVALYKFPSTVSVLRDCDIALMSSSQGKLIRLTPDELNKKTYPKLKAKIAQILSKNQIDTDHFDNIEEELDNKALPKNLDDMSTDQLVKKINTKDDLKKEEVKKEILNTLTKGVLGSVEDVTDKEDKSEIQSDSDKINDIKNTASKYLDEHEELLQSDSEDNIKAAVDEVEKEVKRRHYISEYTPKYTDKQMELIEELSDIQLDIIGDVDDSLENMESKVIDESDYSNVVKTTNPNITTSKFVNFDRDYVKKKLPKDIDNSIAALSNASKKVFIVGKDIEDTSDTLTMKKTYTYKLKDEDGKRMTIKVDIPVIFDDHYMMIKGNKKVIQHTLILKPLVKTGKDTVQINSNYQKMFIMLNGSVDLKTNALQKLLLANKSKFNVVTGNGVATNKKYITSLEYNGIARKIVEFTAGDIHFILDIAKIETLVNQKGQKMSNFATEYNIIVGFNERTKKFVTIPINSSFVDFVFEQLSDDEKMAIYRYGRKMNGKSMLHYSMTKPLRENVPLVVLLMYYEGFTKVMEKSGIEYHVVHTDQVKEADKKYDLFEWGTIDLADGVIYWKRYPMENSFLMNGLSKISMEEYGIEDLDNRDMWMYQLTSFYNFANQSMNLDQYYDFMIDPITKEILKDMHLPTDLVSLCLLANKMLVSEEFTPEGDLNSMRVRSNEIIAYHLYKVITNAYRNYRKTSHRRNPEPITIKQSAVIDAMSTQAASAMNDASSLNPMMEISKLRAITYKGESGTNEEHAFKLNVRDYNESMLGVIGITTSPDSGVGINRQMSLEPNITSTRGYIESVGKDNVEELNPAQLLTPTEMLTPLGVQHDDPTRTSMAYKQSIAMVLPEKSDPVLIGNGVEKVLPYHLSSEFVINAEEDGKVVDETDEYTVIQYKSGRYRTIDKTININKNASAGFFIESKLTTNLHVGDTFKKNEIVAWDDKAFKKHGNDPSVAMRLGPLVKIGIVPEWDIYEDSAPVSKRASEKLVTTMVMPVNISLSKDAYVAKMVKVGDHVEAGDTLILFDDNMEDEMVREMIESLREDEREEIIESYGTSKKTHYTGTIVDIDAVTTVPVAELSETLQTTVKNIWKKIRRRDKILKKYANEDDLNSYKSGNVITKSTLPVKPDYAGKIKGNYIKDGEGVLITIYVSFKDVLSRGDKIASQFALKAITSHVLEEGMEPYSEFRPDEPIDLIVAPLSISARKTPSIFIAMFGNKILIEAKRHLKDFWEKN